MKGHAVVALAGALVVFSPLSEARAAGKRVAHERPKIAEVAAGAEKKVETPKVPGVGDDALAKGIDAVTDAAGLDLGNRTVAGGEAKVEAGTRTRVSDPKTGGFVEVELVRREAAASGRAGTVKNGVEASGAANVGLTAAAVSGGTGKAVAGNDTARVEAQAAGEANVAAKAQGQAAARATTHGVEASAAGSAFVGARAQGQVTGKTTLCGITVSAKGDGEVSAGVGASGSAHVKADWAHLTFGVGASANATAGVGGGLGGDVTVAIDPGKAAKCAGEAVEKVKDAGQTAIAKAVDVVEEKVRPAVEDAAQAVAELVSSIPAPKTVIGSNAQRDDATRAPGRAVASGTSRAAAAQAAGMAR